MTPDSQKPDNDRLVNLSDLEALREEIRAIREDIGNLMVRWTCKHCGVDQVTECYHCGTPRAK